jgi:hypothetical protein
MRHRLALVSENRLKKRGVGNNIGTPGRGTRRTDAYLARRLPTRRSRRARRAL